MNHLFIFVSLFIAQFTWATSFYDQLCTFNPTWKDYSDRAPKGESRIFETDQAYIQAHLGAVLDILKSNSVKSFTSEQKRSRRNLIQQLNQYRKEGNFPKNYYSSDRTPVFIDEHGTHCAVGYLLLKTGYEDVAQRIAATNNYAWVKEITDPALPAWQVASGFTLAELKLIQGAYDSYLDNALIMWNRFEIPQRPAVMATYFSSFLQNIDDTTDYSKKVWCYGEGENGILNGKWIQNYRAELPWIIGFYENGKRTGKWAEYYQGTTKLCRTEYWENDKLNGVRTRFNKEGEIIEEIVFKDGEALLKTNFDKDQGMRWERTPIDSNQVWTKIYTTGNILLAQGEEIIYNPGNLLWFQNIELTVLNTISLSARDVDTQFSGLNSSNPYNKHASFQRPALVDYKKEGDWMYYAAPDYSLNYYYLTNIPNQNSSYPPQGYLHLQEELLLVTSLPSIHALVIYDSIQVNYSSTIVQNWLGYLSPISSSKMLDCIISLPGIEPPYIWWEGTIYTDTFLIYDPSKLPGKPIHDSPYQRLMIWERMRQELYVMDAMHFFKT